MESLNNSIFVAKILQLPNHRREQDFLLEGSGELKRDSCASGESINIRI